MSDNPTPGGNLDTGGTPGGADGAQGGGSEQWYSSLPEDLHGDPNITKYQSMEDFARGHVSAVSMLGRDKIPMPKSDAEFRDVFAKLGMPGTADDYQFEQADYNVPADIYTPEARESDLKAFRGWAHDLGLTNKQASGLYDKFMKHQEGSLQSLNRFQDVEMAKCNDIMHQTWGEAAEANLTIANRALTKIFGKDVADAVAASGLGRNFAFIQGLHQLGMRSLDELGIDKRGNSTRTPEQLHQEIGQLQAHPAYFDSTHPEHKMVNEQVLALMERIPNRG